VIGLRVYFAVHDGAHFIVFRYECDFGIVKTHSLVYSDHINASTNVKFSRSDANYSFLIQPMLYSRYLQNLTHCDDFLTTISKDKYIVQTYVSAAVDQVANPTVTSSITLLPSEFQQYDSSCESCSYITSLKFVKYVLEFANERAVMSEALGMFISTQSNTLILSTLSPSQSFHVDLVLSTSSMGSLAKLNLPFHGTPAGAPPTPHQPAPPPLAAHAEPRVATVQPQSTDHHKRPRMDVVPSSNEDSGTLPASYPTPTSAMAIETLIEIRKAHQGQQEMHLSITPTNQQDDNNSLHQKGPPSQEWVTARQLMAETVSRDPSRELKNHKRTVTTSISAEDESVSPEAHISQEL
jgi:Rad9